MKNDKCIYGYARVSTKDQNEDRQIMALKAIGVPDKNIYVDKVTGIGFERTEYKKLLKRLDSDSVLYIESLDRLGRNYRELSEQWRVLTREKGADIVIIDMPLLDTRGDKNLLGLLISDLVLALLSYVAETEYNIIHQRQAEGIMAAKIRGVRMGRPPKPLPDNFDEICQKWKRKEITLAKAARECNMPQTTFYEKVKAYSEMNN